MSDGVDNHALSANRKQTFLDIGYGFVILLERLQCPQQDLVFRRVSAAFLAFLQQILNRGGKWVLHRVLAKTWRPGDEVLVTGLEHDANYTPWLLAAEDAGATVRCVNIHADDCTCPGRVGEHGRTRNFRMSWGSARS